MPIESFVAVAMVRMDSPSRWRVMMMRCLSALTTRGAPTGAASAAGCVEAVAGFAGDIAAAVFGESQCQVEDEAAFGVFAGRDPIEDFHGDTAGEGV
ncbi:hypothetical protein [Subtercola boreus]|uniref:hypothetical protein n=1 Tax=Subtercola boreus TaxID=120213 RepID=UPI00155835AF|nr:hypothetical protein [Subtercola boreus]